MTISTSPWWTKDTVAVVTGSNKGIGYEIVRKLAGDGLTVVLTARDTAKGEAAIASLKAEGLHSVAFHLLDVSSSHSVQKLATWLKNEYGGIDILVNNAGALGNSFDYKTAKLILDTNYYGVKIVTEGLLPVLRASPAGARIVNITSRLGLYERFGGESLKKNFRDEDKYSEELADELATQYLEDVKAGRQSGEGWPWLSASQTPIYSESKMFLNVYSISKAKSLAKLQPDDHQIFVVSFCPGATGTDMLDSAIAGGYENDGPPKSVEDGADTGVWLALLPKEELVEKNGKLFGERKEYPFSMGR